MIDAVIAAAIWTRDNICHVYCYRLRHAQIKLVETLSSSQQASRDEAARKRAQAVALANASGGPSWHAAPTGPSSRIVQRNGFQDAEDRFGAEEDEDSQPARGR